VVVLGDVMADRDVGEHAANVHHRGLSTHLAIIARIAPTVALLVGCREVLGIDERATGEGGAAASSTSSTSSGESTAVSSTAASGGAGGAGGTLGGGGGGSCSMDLFVLEPLPECVTCLREHCCDVIDACAEDAGCVACTHAASDCAFPGTWTELKACVREGACADECYPEPGVAQEPGYCDGPDLDPGPGQGACGLVDGAAWCNPMRQSPTCSFELGLTCDLAPREPRPGTATQFACFVSEGARHVCSDCGVVEGPCHFGLTCANSKCMRFCCDDADCGADRCDTTWIEYRFQGEEAPPIGVCVR
jgi:hypothetical protein